MKSTNKGGMPRGRHKLGSAEDGLVKVEFRCAPEEKELIEQAARSLRLTNSHFCASASVTEAKAVIAKKLRQ